MTPKTWDTYHRRDEVLRTVITEANIRRDGVIPMELPGVTETFGDELGVIAALQLRWHTRLAGAIETGLMDAPADLESAVLTAWRATAAELVGVRQILDAATTSPTSVAMATALERSHRKDWALMAAMSGLGFTPDARAATVGRRIEDQARAAYNPALAPRHRGNENSSHTTGDTGERHGSLLGRLKAHLVA